MRNPSRGALTVGRATHSHSSLIPISTGGRGTAESPGYIWFLLRRCGGPCGGTGSDQRLCRCQEVGAVPAGLSILTCEHGCGSRGAQARCRAIALLAILPRRSPPTPTIAGSHPIFDAWMARSMELQRHSHLLGSYDYFIPPPPLPPLSHSSGFGVPSHLARRI